MEMRFLRAPRVVAAVALLLSFVLVGQAMTDSLAPRQADTGRAIGRAGFAYLTGVRTFIAAVLWNRLDPQFHEYYSGVSLSDQIYMMPTINAITTLDPQFIDAYYVAAWILTSRGQPEEGLELAALGVENNPRSGILRTSYAQILHLHAGDIDGAIAQADIALQDGTWRNAFEQHDNYAILKSIYKAAGDTAKVDQLDAEIERIDELLGDSLPPGTHDHDGDGVADH
jgi:hypothetical protein